MYNQRQYPDLEEDGTNDKRKQMTLLIRCQVNKRRLPDLEHTSVMFNIWPTTIYQQASLTNNTQQLPVLPASLAKHPQQWTKHEVVVWLKWCSDEYCIEPIPPDKLDMNGKALCLLKRSDFMERIPKNGDLIFNALQKLMQKTSAISNPMSSVCNLSAAIPMSPFIKAEPVSPIMHPLVLTSANTQTTSMHAPCMPNRPRPCVPILPHTQSSLLPPNSVNHGMHQSKHFSNTVSTVPGILSPAPSNIDTESASSDGGSVSELEGLEKEDTNSKQPNDRFLPTTIKTEIHSIQSAFQAVNHSIKPESECRLLWEFIHQLLQNPMYSQLVCWENEKEFIFRINNPTGLASLWGQQKNRTNMTYEKLSRALRYYYRMNIIKKVSGKRLTYKFMQRPSTIQKGQRGAKPHHKCDLPLLSSSHRFPYSGPKETVDGNYPRCSSSGSHDRTHTTENCNRKESPQQCGTDMSDRSEDTSLSSKSNGPESHEQSSDTLSKDEFSNSMFNNFRISDKLYDNIQKKPLAFMLHPSLNNEKIISGAFNKTLHSSYETFHMSGKHFKTFDKNSKRHYVDGIHSPSPHLFDGHFKDEPQNEPEDLSLPVKKQRRESEESSENGTIKESEEKNYSENGGGNILPLLINYKKTHVEDS